MIVKIHKEFAQLVGLKALEAFGASEVGWSHRDEREIDLSDLLPKQLLALQSLLEKHPKARGVSTSLWDLRVWHKAQTDPNQRARSVKQMTSLMKGCLRKVDGHRVYRQEDEHWYAYYVNAIEYCEKEVRRDYYDPEHITVGLVYEELGGRHKDSVRLDREHVAGRTPTQAMAEKNLFPETPALRKAYLEEYQKFMVLQPQVGLQLCVWGVGTDNLDGNEDTWKVGSHRLGTREESSRAVVDVFREEAGKDHEEKVYLRPEFWDSKGIKSEIDDDDDDNITEVDLSKKRPGAIEVPVHPTLAAFHLTLHLRMRIHVSDCEVHKYDTSLAEKLVLPQELKDLVSLLIEHRAGGFQDIVKGKSGGAVVLLAGPPGTGKTLTAQVYAESEQRALYSVQCSQLGIKPDELEASLLQCFMRASRWNAVMLLDEADVYVHERGKDLVQNAIVGVFLRVLEYQSAVLFLTTNRPQDVDDAILSRCIARLVYAVPSPADQARIWAILAETGGASLSSKEIGQIVSGNPQLSGRDVKNLLKLAMLMSKGCPITAKQVEFVKQFKPTEPVETSKVI